MGSTQSARVQACTELCHSLNSKSIDLRRFPLSEAEFTPGTQTNLNCFEYSNQAPPELEANSRKCSLRCCSPLTFSVRISAHRKRALRVPHRVPVLLPHHFAGSNCSATTSNKPWEAIPGQGHTNFAEHHGSEERAAAMACAYRAAASRRRRNRSHRAGAGATAIAPWSTIWLGR